MTLTVCNATLLRKIDCGITDYCEGNSNNQGPDFDHKSSFFSCEIDDAIQYINLGYGAQAPKIVIL